MCGSDLNPWSLPTRLEVAGRQIPIRADFRQILRILAVLSEEEQPEFLRWCKALKLFYTQPIVPHERTLAAQRLCDFITCGHPGQKGRRLLCWQHDAPVIAMEVNRVAGQEIRQLEFLHWWTFLGWFHAIGDGPLAQILSIRRKLATGEQLTKEERLFYRQNRSRIRLPESEQVAREKAQLEQMLRGKGGDHGTESINAQ